MPKERTVKPTASATKGTKKAGEKPRPAKALRVKGGVRAGVMHEAKMQSLS